MKSAVFKYRTLNLGDDMQSFATMLNIGRIDRFVDRDRLADERLRGPHLSIFNSWFMLGEDFRVPGPDIYPILHGFALGRPQMLEAGWLDYLRARGPVGCRDRFTQRALAERGVETYWSGCLTQSLGRFFEPVCAEERQGVVMIDVDSEFARRVIPQGILSTARTDTMYLPRLDRRLQTARILRLGRLIDRLRTAELVVTRRLHVALPAASFGTPVIVLPDAMISSADRRFDGYMDFLPGAFQADAAGIAKIDWDAREKVTVPESIGASMVKLTKNLSGLGFGLGDRVFKSGGAASQWVLRNSPSIFRGVLNIGRGE